MPDQCPAKCDEPHFYGGQAVIEGVMMRGTDKYAVAVRRADGEIVLGEKDIPALSGTRKWLKWPFIRGCWALVDSVVLGFASLQFSADILAQEEHRKAREEAGEAPDAEEPAGTGGIGAVVMGATTLLASLLAIGLFVVLPTFVVDWVLGKQPPHVPYSDSVVRNLVEGCFRLAVIVLYIVAISLMQYVRRVFQYHGAEHATINCYEAGDPVVPDNVLHHTQLHPRCGTAFLLVVILVKIIVGSFFGWPSKLMRTIIRLALLPIVAGIAYEIIRWAGRHRDSVLSRLLAAPGMLMQLLTTRRPSPDQAEVAIYALVAVACDVPLPAGWSPARRVPIPLKALPPAAPEADGGTAAARGTDTGEA